MKQEIEKPEQKTKKLQIVNLKNVETENIEFLWKPYIPVGKLTLIDGDPGVGKSWVSCAIATAISKGVPLPGNDFSSVGQVLMLSTEDGISDSMKPRLKALGADCSKINVIPEHFELSNGGLELLEQAVEEITPALIFIDPLQAYIGAKINMGLANEVRPIMAKLARLAEKWHCAVVMIRHLNKGGAEKGLYRGLGSIDFAAACRSVLLVGHDKNNRDELAVIQVKCNIARIGKPIGYELRENQFFWKDTELTEGDILGARTVDGNATTEAIEFLKELLNDEPMQAKDILKEAETNGIKKRPLYLAKKKLKIKSKREEFGKEWYWFKP